MDIVPEENFLEGLKNSMQECQELIGSISDNLGNYAYETGKWTIKEVLQHICDAERIFQYRALCISRGEKRKLNGFDQDDYVANCAVDDRSLSSILDDYMTVRLSTISLFKSLNEEQLKLKGNASGFDSQPVFYGYLISGHLRHHLNVIKERYLVND